MSLKGYVCLFTFHVSIKVASKNSLDGTGIFFGLIKCGRGKMNDPKNLIGFAS